MRARRQTRTNPMIRPLRTGRLSNLWLAGSTFEDYLSEPAPGEDNTERVRAN